MKEEMADRKALGGEYGCEQRHFNYSIRYLRNRIEANVPNRRARRS